jgi:N-ethylmaleimide reductase
VRDGSDKRADVYGEPVENRARFLLEVVEAMVSLWAGNRVAVRIGSSGTLMEYRTATRKFDYLAQQLNSFGLAYLHLIEPRIRGNVVSKKICHRIQWHDCARFSKGKSLRRVDLRWRRGDGGKGRR